MKKTTIALAAALTMPWLAACGSRMETPSTAADAVVDEGISDSVAGVTSVMTPTTVVRLGPTAVPTVDPQSDPMAPVPVEGMPGLVVPSAARLVEFLEPAGTQDARADYSITDMDRDELAAWFEEQLAASGWELRDEVDGSLLFVHAKDLSGRFAEEGLKRSAAVHFDTLEDVEEGQVGFSIVAEAPLSQAGGD